MYFLIFSLPKFAILDILFTSLQNKKRKEYSIIFSNITSLPSSVSIGGTGLLIVVGVALETYKQISPNLVFLDLTMPVMDGFEALGKIKEFDKNAKVVILSADIQKLSVERVLALGAFNFIKKPIDSTKMQQIISKINGL